MRRPLHLQLRHRIATCNSILALKFMRSTAMDRVEDARALRWGPYEQSFATDVMLIDERIAELVGEREMGRQMAREMEVEAA